MNDIGFAAPSRCALANRRRANRPLGTTQHSPPSTAENIAGHPPSSAATTPATTVAINCRETMRSIFLLRASRVKAVSGVGALEQPRFADRLATIETWRPRPGDFGFRSTRAPFGHPYFNAPADSPHRFASEAADLATFFRSPALNSPSPDAQWRGQRS
jgi:hypothetical protein